MRIDVFDIRTTEKLDMNLLLIEDFRPHVVQVDPGHWHVILNDRYRVPEVFESKSDAIREMNGLKRDMIRVQADEEARREAEALAPISIDDVEDDDDPSETESEHIL